MLPITGKFYRFIVLFFAFYFYADSGISQTGNSAWNDSLVWFGLDFSEAKLIGDFARWPAEKLRDDFLPSINSILFYEYKKYSIRKTFFVKWVYYDILPTEHHNAEITPGHLRDCRSDYKFENPEKQLSDVIASLRTGDAKSGIGLILIVESFNKYLEEGSIYVTFFNIATKKLIFSERLTGTAGGLGLPAHWARVVRHIFDLIYDHKMREWNAMNYLNR